MRTQGIHIGFRAGALALLLLILGTAASFAQTTVYTTGGLSVQVSVLNPCEGDDNGSIEFRVLSTGNGGDATLDFIFGPQSDFNDHVIAVNDTYTFNGGTLEAGDYDFVMYDGSGNNINTLPAATPPITLTDLAVIVITDTGATDLSNSDCDNPDAQLEISISGGSTVLAGGGSFSYTWTSSNSLQDISGTWDGTGTFNLADSLAVAGLFGGVYELTISDNYSECSTTKTWTIVDPSPALQTISTASPLQVCTGEDAEIELGNSEGALVTYEVLRNGNPTGISQTGTNAALTFTLPNGSFSDGDVITVRGTNADCTGSPLLMAGSVTIDIVPLPNATITPSGPYCSNGSAVTLSAATAGGTWSGTGITNGANGTFDPTVAGQGSHVITYTVTVSGCTNSDTETFVVNSPADPTITAAGPFCTNSAAVNLAAATAGGTWSGTGITNAALGTFNPATAGAGTHTITYSITVAGCGTFTDTQDIVVNQLPNATITPAGPFCVNSASTNLTAATAGGTWSGTGITNAATGTFDPATAGAGTHTITYSITVAGCGTITDTENIVVNAIPDPTITAAGPFCSNGTATNLTAATAGGTWSGTGITNASLGTFNPATAGVGTHTITYSITVAGCGTFTDTQDIVVNQLPNATITPAGPFCENGTAVTLTAATAGGTWSGTGITDANAGTFNPATAGDGTHTITYSITVAGCGTISDTENIVVNAVPDPTITAAGPFCSNGADVNLSAATAGGTWSGTGITNGALGTFDPSAAGAGSHVITYTITTSGCGTFSDTETITVNLAADPTITPVGDICSNASSFSMSAATGGGTWSGTGITNPATGTFNPLVAGVGTHTITYTITVAGCGTVSDTEDITVNQLPDATITAAGPFCSNSPSVNLVAGTTGGTWSGTGITDFTNGTFNPATAGAGSHVITYSITVAGCGTFTDTETIVVNQLPDATISAAGPFCDDDAAVTLSAGTSGGTWSGTGITNASTGTFDPQTAGPGTHTISYSITAAGCGTFTDDIDIVVNPVPDATITGAGPFCTNSAALNLAAATPGGTWSGTGITSAVNGTFNPATAGAGSHVITYSITLAGCAASDTETIVVNQLPDATIAAAGPFCTDDAAVNLTAGTAGGTWSGNGITDASTGLFNPATAGDGTHTITYSITVAGCGTFTDTQDITVNLLPDPSITVAGPFCVDDAALNLTAATGGGTWSGTGITNPATGAFSPTTAGAGTHVITYSITVGGCGTLTDTENIIVNAIPDPTIAAAGPFCSNDGSVTLVAGTSGGTWSGAGITDASLGSFDPNTAGPGTHTITYSITVAGCGTFSDTHDISVTDAPDAGGSNDITACPSDVVDLFASLDGTPDGGGNWTDLDNSGGNLTGDDVDLTGVAAGAYRFEYRVTGTGPCEDATAIITIDVVTGTPNTGTNTNPVACTSDTDFNLFDALGGSPNPGGSWSDLETSGAVINGDEADFSAVTPGTYDFEYTISLSCGTASTVLAVTINRAPVAGLDNDADVCNTNDDFDLRDNLLGTPDAGGTWTDVDNSGAIITGDDADFSGVAAGTYDFLYTVVAPAGCADATATLTVTIHDQPNAGTSTTADACNTDNAFSLSASLTGEDAGGTWTQTGGAAVSLTVDQVDFTGAAAGSYEFTYSLNGTTPCVNASATVTVTVIAAPQAGNDITTTSCNDVAAYDLGDALVGEDAGGGWVQTGGATLTLNGDQVDLTGAAEGQYTFEYTLTGTTPCGPDAATLTLDVTEAPDAGDATPVSACNTDASFDLFSGLVAGTFDVGGTWAQASGGARPLNVADVDFSGAAPGIYTFTYTVTGDGDCDDAVTTVTVTVVNPPNAGLDNSDDLCNNTASYNLFDNLGGTPDATGSWSQTDGPAITINGNTVDFTGASADQYVFEYTVTGVSPCVNDLAVLTIGITEAPDAGISDDVTVCNSETSFDLLNALDGTPETGGTWTDMDASGAIRTGDLLDLTTVSPGTYRFEYEVQGNAPCTDASAIVTISVINGLPDAGDDAAPVACNSDNAFDLFGALGGSPDPGGVWTDLNSSGAVISGDDADLTAVDPGTYAFQYVLELPGCGNDTSIVNLTVDEGHDAGSDSTVMVCNSEAAFDLFGAIGGSPETGGSWTDLDASGVVINNGVVDFNTVNAGTYDFEYRIAGSVGCTDAFAIVTVNIPVRPDPSVSTTNAACNGIGNGSLTVNAVSNGISPYQYSIDNGQNFQFDPTFNNLGSANYPVVVMDANGCRSTAEVVTINANAFILPTISKEDATCSGVADGAIEVVAITGGSAPFEYSRDNGLNYQSSSIFPTLTGGSNHSLVVRDAAGCKSSAFSIIINDSTSISHTTSIAGVSSCIGNDGRIEVTPQRGTEPFVFSLDNGVTTQDTTVFSSLVPGVYTVLTIDSIGCRFASQVTLEIISNIVPVVGKTDAQCNGVADGAISVTSVTGGKSPYQFSLDNGVNFQSANAFDSLAAGSYSVVVRDTAGCRSSVVAVIVANETTVRMDVLKADETCEGGDGSIQVLNVTGGLAPFDYSIDNGVTFDSTDVFDSLAVGAYNVVVLDSLGCRSAAVSASVITPPDCDGSGTGLCATVSITPEPTAANCANADGAILFDIDPPVPANNIVGVIVTIDGPVDRTQKNNFDFQGLQAGAYNFTVVYGDDQTPACITDGVVVINKAGTVGYPEVVAVTSPQCFGDSTGTVVIDVLQPVDITGQPLQWSLTPGNPSSWQDFVAGGTIIGIPEGVEPDYQQTLSIRRDATDPCYAGVSVFIAPVTDPITADFEVVPATCSDNDGAITNIQPDGGTPSGSTFEFSLDGNVFQTESEFLSLGGGAYDLYVRDQVGCTETFDVFIGSPDQVEISSETVIDASCANNGLSGRLMFEFEDAGTYRVGISSDPFTAPSHYRTYTTSAIPVIFDSLGRGAYYVYVESTGAECAIGQGPYYISGIHPVDFEIEARCVGNDISILLSDIIGDPAKPVQVSVMRTTNSEEVASFVIDPFPVTSSYLIDKDLNLFLHTPDEYTFELSQSYPGGACPEVSSPLRNFIVPAPLYAAITGVEESYPDIATGELIIGGFAGGVWPYEVRVELDSASSPGLPSYVTDFEEVGLNDNQQFEQTYENVPPGRYSVQFTDSLGCIIELITMVPMDIDVFIPNVFTPNEDGSNDIFFIRNLSQVTENVLVITNRWGKEVYASPNYQNDWKGEGAADGIYFYRLQINGKEPITGWVEIMRGQKP